MREIKFRAYCKEINRMVNFKVGEIPHWYNEVLLEEEELGWDSLSEPMQYTGLKDKNGKEIYEGDILGGTPNMHKMEVIMGKYGWNVKFIDLGHKYTEPLRNDLFENFDVEVIGNIYEQPEKLTVKEGNKSNSSQG